ncbi:MerR family transcriptional regulator [Amycolatopsis thermalba]|uniref:MerR family transcriptional regulator n=1 Tax=Amycolatopsis thermalba TaxID=944492 RepID=A0ABY4NUD7_9PSEU|nr:MULTISPECIES: MerR family transcriptional regulator [Amycolatopsis]UQS23663.1 MerR family transcriptional regulator [Amycolatopsis thermalba]
MAAFTGATVKTVWHRQRLLDESPRDSSGYRRYGSADLLRLVQVRTPAEAGVPLAEAGSLVDAEAEQLAAALDGVGRRITERIADLIAGATHCDSPPTATGSCCPAPASHDERPQPPALCPVR